MAARTSISHKSRLLTVGYSFYTYRRDRLPPSSTVPYLRLRGHWLRQAGFTVGQKVSIQITDGRITIVPTPVE